MGGSSSTIISPTCVYNKEDFNKKIDIIKDTYSLMNFYAALLLQQKMPVKLDKYRQFADNAEEYFNTRRKDTIPEIKSINSKFSNYYDFYKALGTLQLEYERSEITEQERRTKIENIFNLAYVTLRLLIEELWISCNVQGTPDENVKKTGPILSDVSSNASSNASNTSSNVSSDQTSSNTSSN